MCALCGNAFHVAETGTEGPVTAAAPTTHLDPVQAGAQITRANYHWGSTVGVATGPITYGFRASAPSYNWYNEQATFTPFTAQEIAAAETAMRLWSNVAGITFSEVNPGSYTNSATILFGNYHSTTDGAQAYAYYPAYNNQSAASHEGDIWLNRAYQSTTSLPFGSYDFLTIVHEIGHALGLAHPGDYNAGSGQPITYTNSAQYVEDTRQYSVMSYFSAANTGANHVYNGQTVYASTPLMHDIAALQRLYGVNTTHAATNTTYGFSSNADTPYRISGSTQQVVFCIWDAGGIDTLNFSGYATNQVISLVAGTFSSVGALTSNVSIAYGAVIENAIGGAGHDTLYGNEIANELTGNAGNDHLHGYGGNDTLSGGSGVDWAHFTLGIASYTFQILQSGVQVIDDFVDTVFSDVEWLSFADTQIAYGDLVSQWTTPTVIESNGSTDLSKLGNRYHLYDGGGVGPSLKYAGVDFVTGQFGAWTPIGVEQTASGYQVAWKITGLDQYMIWNTDSNGNLAPSYNGPFSGSNYTLQLAESGFQQDLNGDGQIGLATTVIESNGSVRLAQVANYFFLQDSGGVGPSLKYAGVDFVKGQFGAWTPIGVEQTASGYQVAWKITGMDQYMIWNTDSNGNLTSNYNGPFSGGHYAIQSAESGFQQDLNGDGQIGFATTVIESNGSARLSQAANYFFLQDSGGVGPSLKYAGADFVKGQFGAWTPIGVEQTASGYQVAWKITGMDQYMIWNTDSNGSLTSNYNGPFSGGSYALQSAESSFQQDLNGDGQIGLATTVIESNGSTRLSQTGNYFFLQDSGGVGPSLKYAGVDFVKGQFGAWTPIGVEQTAGGYQVVWKVTGVDQYMIWNTDSNGNLASNYIGPLSGTNYALQSTESSFLQDLNGDAQIGLAPMMVGGGLPNGTGHALDNVIVGNDGNDLFIASVGTDTFLFKPHFRNDTITDFCPGEDILQFDRTVFADASSVISHTADDGHGNAVIAADANNSITLLDVTTATLQQHLSAFHFV
jgi:serralysin